MKTKILTTLTAAVGFASCVSPEQYAALQAKHIALTEEHYQTTLERESAVQDEKRLRDKAELEKVLAELQRKEFESEAERAREQARTLLTLEQYQYTQLRLQDLYEQQKVASGRWTEAVKSEIAALETKIADFREGARRLGLDVERIDEAVGLNTEFRETLAERAAAIREALRSKHQPKMEN